MKMEELQNEEMYCFVAPDGTPQLSTLAPEFEMCIGFAEMMASTGLVKSSLQMFDEGFKVLPVKVSITQNGTEEEGFQRAKQNL